MSVASKPTPSSTLPSPFLMGLTSLEQLHSSVVIEKDTSSMTLFDSILPGALESVSAGEPPAPARGRGARGGRMRRAGVVQEVVAQHPISGSALFGGQICLFICHPSRGLETPTHFFISCYLPEGWK